MSYDMSDDKFITVHDCKANGMVCPVKVQETSLWGFERSMGWDQRVCDELL